MSKPFNNWPNDAGFDVIHEEREVVELQVTGEIPSYVSGTLYRTGPGGHEIQTDDGETFSVQHWFDGFSQNHRFQILPSAEGTRVLYNSRRSVDPLIERIRKTGQMAGFTFAQKRDPCMGFFKKVMSMFVPEPRPPQEEVNIGVTVSVNPPGFKDIDTGKGQKKGGHASGIQSLWAKTDAAQLREIEPDTLEPLGLVTQSVLHPDLTGVLSAAHAKSDPVTGDIFNYNLALGRTAVYKIFRVSAATGTTDILATITDAPGAYLHSSIITENYFILCIWGGQYAWGGAKMLWEKNLLDALAFDPAQKALWYVIDRRHGKGVVAKYECDPFFCFHTINAWEVPSFSDPSQVDIIADLTTYKNIDVIKRFYYNNIKSTMPDSLEYVGEKRTGSCDMFLRRWRLPGVNTTIDTPSEAREMVTVHTAEPDHSCELPVVNPRFLTKPSRYIYGVCDRGLSTFFDGIVKYDMDTHVPVYWSAEGHSPGEPIFVADPEGTAEDDGVLLSVVLDGFAEKSYLLVLDAKSMKEVGRASMECVVGFGFHGIYHPQAVTGPGTDI